MHEIYKDVLLYLRYMINLSPHDLIDPDMQYNTDIVCTENIKCNSYFVGRFNTTIKKYNKSNLSMFHLNIKSLAKYLIIWIIFELSPYEILLPGVTEYWITDNLLRF